MLPHVFVNWEGRWPSVLLLGERVAPVAGASYNQDALAAVVAQSGQAGRASFYVWLVREPDNPHDPRAVVVMHALQNSGGLKLGYLKAALANTVADEIDAAFRQSGFWPTCIATAHWKQADDRPTGGLFVARVYGPWSPVPELSWATDIPPTGRGERLR